MLRFANVLRGACTPSQVNNGAEKQVNMQGTKTNEQTTCVHLQAIEDLKHHLDGSVAFVAVLDDGRNKLA